MNVPDESSMGLSDSCSLLPFGWLPGARGSCASKGFGFSLAAGESKSSSSTRCLDRLAFSFLGLTSLSLFDLSMLATGVSGPSFSFVFSTGWVSMLGGCS